MNSKLRIALTLSVSLASLMIVDIEAHTTQDSRRDVSSRCPSPGTAVPLGKAMSSAFINDYKGCDISVEATFFRIGNEGSSLGKYDTKSNVTFQVIEPGGAPESRRGRERGTFAGIAKAKSGILFELKEGDSIVLRGAPVSSSFGLAIFQAESVTKK